jgi:hypothetical protein
LAKSTNYEAPHYAAFSTLPSLYPSLVQIFSSTDNIDITNKNTQTLIDASKEVGLEVNIEKTKYMLVSCDQSAGQNQDIKIRNSSFEKVSQFKYLGTTVTN